jgi:hypothetical protein
VLRVSFGPTGEPTGTEFHSSASFLYNPKFRLADYFSACHLLSRWFLALLTLNGLHGVLYQKMVLFK